MATKGYNGWRNYDTWNVSLWINNDHDLYNSAWQFMHDKGKKMRAPYKAFIEELDMSSLKTPDGAPWISSHLGYEELNAMMDSLLT